MHPPPVLPDEDSRIASLRALGVLDTPAEERFDRITRLAAAVLDAPISLVSLVDTNRQWFKSCVGLGVSETSRDLSFCGHAIAQDEPLVVEDALADERFADNPLVIDEPRVRFYAGFPLGDGSGHNLGTLCVIDHEPRQVTPRELDLLGELARWAAEELRSIGLERALAQHRASQARIDAISNVLLDALVTVDVTGTVLAANAAAGEMFGHATTGELVGGSLARLVPACGEAEGQRRESEAAELTAMDRLLRGDRETVGRRADGTCFPIDVSVGEVVSGGTVQYVCLIHDITEKKRAEDRLRDSEALHRGIVEAMAEGLVVHDTTGAILGSNAAAERILGLTADQIAGRTSMDPRWRAVRSDGTLFPGGEHPAQVTLRTGDSCRDVIMGVHRPDSSLRWISINSEPLTTGEGGGPGEADGPGAVVTFADVTHRMEVDRLKSEFVSIVSHELRTPLTSIRGALGLLADGLLAELPERPQQVLDIAVANTERLARLIDDILDIERIESGLVSLDVRKSRAGDLIHQAADVMQATADRAGITLDLEATEATLWVDRDRIGQALTNLVSNAIKFSPPGAVVHVRCRQEGEETLFEVVDRGRGIPADKLESIFERFQQVDASDSRDKGGTGLGLAICKTIVEQHGGRLWVESVLGEGSTFRFALPTLELPPEEESPATPPGTPRRHSA